MTTPGQAPTYGDEQHMMLHHSRQRTAGNDPPCFGNSSGEESPNRNDHDATGNGHVPDIRPDTLGASSRFSREYRRNPLSQAALDVLRALEGARKLTYTQLRELGVGGTDMPALLDMLVRRQLIAPCLARPDGEESAFRLRLQGRIELAKRASYWITAKGEEALAHGDEPRPQCVCGHDHHAHALRSGHCRGMVRVVDKQTAEVHVRRCWCDHFEATKAQKSEVAR